MAEAESVGAGSLDQSFPLQGVEMAFDEGPFHHPKQSTHRVVLEVHADDTSVTTYTWSPCRASSKVVLEVVKGGGHEWFGPSTGAPDASRLGWAFFTQAPPLT